MNTGMINSIAGNGQYGQYQYLLDGTAKGTSTPLYYPMGVWSDTNGNVYVTEEDLQSIFKIDRNTKLISRFAGSQQPYNEYYSCQGFQGDLGPATTACLNTPRAITGDIAGNVYFRDTYNYRIRRVSGESRVISTVSYDGGAYDPTGKF